MKGGRVLKLFKIPKGQALFVGLLRKVPRSLGCTDAKCI